MGGTTPGWRGREGDAAGLPAHVGLRTAADCVKGPAKDAVSSSLAVLSFLRCVSCCVSFVCYLFLCLCPSFGRIDRRVHVLSERDWDVTAGRPAREVIRVQSFFLADLMSIERHTESQHRNGE